MMMAGGFSCIFVCRGEHPEEVSTSGSLEPSHVMRAMGIPYTAAHGTIRFSLSVDNTEAEIDRVIAAVPPIIAQLRKLSPYWGEQGPAADQQASFAPTYA